MLRSQLREQVRFSDFFGIKSAQSQLDFVDIPLNTDINLYVDPYALHVSQVDWLRTCGDLVANYFQLLIDALRSHDEAKTLHMLSNLKEPNETRLGQSKGRAAGRGWGKVQSRELYNVLSKSKAVSSGRLKDLGDFELLIPGIGNDKISDLAINVIRSELVDYTQEQCDLYGVETEKVPAGNYWNPTEERWEGHFADLPVYEGEGLLLVPKIAVRRRLVPDYQEYYTRHVLPFLETEHINAGSALVHTLKNGNPKVYKSDLRAKYKISKDLLFSFSEENPSVLSAYKKTLPDKAAQVIANETIESEQQFGRLINKNDQVAALANIPTGPGGATTYQNFIVGAFQELFYPALTRPTKEQAVDNGRKRIDIFFHNSADSGFFAKLIHLHRYHAPYISVECKNYSTDIENPEIDQLLGRLNRKRGYVGILTCRHIADRKLLLKRCRDIVNNNDKHLVMVLDDQDLSALFNLIAKGEKKKINEYLEDRLKEILT